MYIDGDYYDGCLYSATSSLERIVDKIAEGLKEERDLLSAAQEQKIRTLNDNLEKVRHLYDRYGDSHDFIGE